MNLFFPGNPFRINFFPCGVPLKIYFFLEKGLRNFFSRSPLPPRSLMVVPLGSIAQMGQSPFWNRNRPLLNRELGGRGHPVDKIYKLFLFMRKLYYQG